MYAVCSDIDLKEVIYKPVQGPHLIFEYLVEFKVKIFSDYLATDINQLYKKKN